MNTDDYVEDGAGILWLLRDTVRNRAMPNMIAGLLSSTPGLPEEFAEYRSFMQPPSNIANAILQAMHWQNDPDTNAVVWGVMRHLGNMLQRETGIGNHFLAIRPLVDPQRAWIDLRTRSIALEDSVIRESPVQLIGLEYFGINHFLRNYLPWGEVQWWVLVSFSRGGRDFFWRLDTSNLRGESLVPGAGRLVGFLVLLNGKCLSPLEMKIFYNELRKRALGWSWYQEQDTSWREVIDTLQALWRGQQVDKSILAKCQEIGLLTQEQHLSPTGASLLREQTAIQRRHITFAGREL